MSFQPFRTPALAIAAGLAGIGFLALPSVAHTQGAEPGATANDAELRFVEIDGSCGVTEGRKAWCWGSGQYGRLGVTDTALIDETCDPWGHGAVPCTSRPVRVAPDREVAGIEGAGMRCLLTTDGETYCWGNNHSGQLGTDHDRRPRNRTPRPVRGEVAFERITTGFAHGCGLTVDGTVYCWGANAVRQTGTRPSPQDMIHGHLREEPTPVRGNGRYHELAAGRYHSCAITTAGSVHCWGMNEHGQLGRATSGSCFMQRNEFPCDATPRPVPVPEDPPFADLAAGNAFTCGITDAGEAWCWGRNAQGQLGTGEAYYGDSDGPVRVAGDVRFTEIEAGTFHTCGLGAEGRVFCWGWNESRQGAVAVPSAEVCSRNTPRRSRDYTDALCALVEPTVADTELRFTDLAVNGATTCGIATDGRTYCWGAEDFNRLGTLVEERDCDWRADCSLTPLPLSPVEHTGVRGDEVVFFAAMDSDLLERVYDLLGETGYRSLGARNPADLQRRLDYYEIEDPIPVAYILVDAGWRSIEEPAKLIDALREVTPGIRVTLVDGTPDSPLPDALRAVDVEVMPVTAVEGRDFLRRVRATIDANSAEQGGT